MLEEFRVTCGGGVVWVITSFGKVLGFQNFRARFGHVIRVIGGEILVELYKVETNVTKGSGDFYGCIHVNHFGL